VAVQNVHAHVVGEHGDSEVALWSNASIGGVPLDHWGPALGGPPGDEERSRMLARVRDAGYRIIAGKGATNFAIGTVAARVIEAIVRDERRVLPVSSFLQGWLGFDDVCMSVPSVVGRAGVEAHLAVPMSDAEHADLEASAQVIRDTYARTQA
jgi:L-lactate dehydrogenase